MPKYINLTPEEKFMKARIELNFKDPFIGRALFLLRKPVNTSEEGYRGERVPTMAVDGLRMYYNEEFINSLPYEEFLFVVMHEVLHILLMHPLRMKGKNHRVYNIAGDLWINQRLMNQEKSYKERGLFFKPVKGGLFANDPSITEKTVDEIYEELMQQYNQQKKQQQQQGQGQSEGMGSQDQSDDSLGGESNQQEDQSGDQQGDQQGNQQQTRDGVESKDGELYDNNIKVSDIELKYGDMKIKIREVEVDVMQGAEGASDDEIEREIKGVISEAFTHEQTSKMPGLGNSMEELGLVELFKVKTVWHRHLDKYLRKRIIHDTSFSSPDRNYLHRDLIIPGRFEDRTKLDNVMIAIDCSGSIWGDHELFGKFWYNIDRIMKKYRADGKVILWDTEVGNVINLKDFDTKKNYKIPSGGTDPTCVYE